MKPTAKTKEALAKLNELPVEALKEFETTEDLKKEVTRLTSELKKQKGSSRDRQQLPKHHKDSKLKAEIANLKEVISKQYGKLQGK
jgi:hypothetical protein